MLAGSLREFRLADVFQLLTLTKKSGTLRIRHGDSEGRIEFTAGDVAFAVADARRCPLAARLLAHAGLDEEQLRRVVAAQAAGGAHVVDVVSQSADNEAVALELVREQVLEAVFALMRLEDADFSFDASEASRALAGGTSTTEELVRETETRLTAWADVVTALPSPTSVLALASRPRTADVSIPADLWALVSLVDGHRTVAEVCELAGRGEFATSRALARLVADGVLETAGDPASTTVGRLAAQRALLQRLEEQELGATSAHDLTAASMPRPPAPAVVTPPAPEVVKAATTDVPADTSFEPETLESEDPYDGVEAEGPPAAEVPEPVAHGHVDRAQVARELASLGFGDPPVEPGRDPGWHDDEGRTARATRDEEVNRGLLMRLIDGVKQA